MVCIYCAGPLFTGNSRARKQLNQVWRRRTCRQCGAVFTTTEAVDLSATFAVSDAQGVFTPLCRDKLFLSILKSCQHRKTAVPDASALTATVLAHITKSAQEGRIVSRDIISHTHKVLQRFDHAAAVQYAAYHPF